MRGGRKQANIRLPKLNPKSARRPPRHVVPKAELGLTVDLTKNWSQKFGHRDTDIVIKGSKSFADMPPSEHVKLFLHKCTECQKLCDFSSPEKDSKAKVTKSLLLKHLIQCFSMVGFLKMLTDDMMKSFYQMVSVNLFRAFPKLQELGPLDAVDTYFDTAWPHLTLVYQCLEASLSSTLTSKMTSSFIYNLVSNGLSPDSSERIAVRDFLHSLYSRYMGQRMTIRKHVFAMFTMGNASAELIDFYASVVQGFNPPLKDEHVNFFYHALLPLLGHPKLQRFSQSLVTCIIKFVEKSFIFLAPTFEYLSKHWPRQESKKQLAYLDIIRTLLTSFETFTDESLTYAFNLIGDAVRSENVDVAELAFDILMDDDFVNVYKINANLIYSLLFEKIYRSAKYHWDENIRTDAVACLQVLSEIEPNIFTKLTAQRKENHGKKNTNVQSFKEKWLTIFDSAKKNDTTMKTLKIDTVVLSAN